MFHVVFPQIVPESYQSGGIKMPKKLKHVESEKRLPPELHDTYDKLVMDYLDRSQYHVSDHKKRVNYGILADLVLAGWRKTT